MIQHASLYLSRYGLTFSIWVAAGLSVLNLVLAVFLLPETRKPDSRPMHERTISPMAFVRVLQHPVVGLCVALTFVTTAAFAMMESSFTLYAEHTWKLDAMGVGRMFSVSGLITVFTSYIADAGLVQPAACFAS